VKAGDGHQQQAGDGHRHRHADPALERSADAPAHQNERRPAGGGGEGEEDTDGIEARADCRRQQEDSRRRQQDAEHVHQPPRCRERNAQWPQKFDGDRDPQGDARESFIVHAALHAHRQTQQENAERGLPESLRQRRSVDDAENDAADGLAQEQDAQRPVDREQRDGQRRSELDGDDGQEKKKRRRNPLET
jgi:hypothetical protein